MDNVIEISAALNLGFEGFKGFIERTLHKEPNYLQQFFYVEEGSQMTVLNYLIQHHHEEKESSDTQKKMDLTPHIDFILELSTEKNAGEPLHFALTLGKQQLALHLLDGEVSDKEFNLKKALQSLGAHASKEKKKCCFDVNRRDNQGRTLLSLVLELKRLDLLCALLKHHPNIHAPTRMFEAPIWVQPIHQAIVLDFAEGVHLLTHQGAKLANPMGPMRDTPLILSARYGAFEAMDALMEYPEQVMLDACNKRFFDANQIGKTAIDELCTHVANKRHTQEALSKIAMLLCCGAQPPAHESMRTMLSTHRMSLLREIEGYLEHKPHLVDAFVSRCHEKESPLHQLFYANHSFNSSVRRFFGAPSEAALLIENLVVRKYNKPTTPLEVPLSIETPDQLKKEKNKLKLYAEFVRRYTQAYDNQMITNRWSTMRWMIAEGRCDWKAIVDYARANPHSRTRIIWNEMFRPLPKVHEDVTPPVAQPVAHAEAPSNNP